MKYLWTHLPQRCKGFFNQLLFRLSMRFQKKIFAVFILAFFLISAVGACSPVQRQVTVDCGLPNGFTAQFSPNILKDSMVYQYRYEDNLSTKLGDCKGVINSSLVRQEVEEWNSRWDGYFTGSSMLIEPYKEEKADKFRKQNDKTGCYYRNFSKEGEWLVSYRDMRSYCRLEGGEGGTCPSAERSTIKFVAYLATNPEPDNLRALLPYIVNTVLLAIAAGLIYSRRQQLKKKFSRDSKTDT